MLTRRVPRKGTWPTPVQLYIWRGQLEDKTGVRATEANEQYYFPAKRRNNKYLQSCTISHSIKQRSSVTVKRSFNFMDNPFSKVFDKESVIQFRHMTMTCTQWEQVLESPVLWYDARYHNFGASLSPSYVCTCTQSYSNLHCVISQNKVTFISTVITSNLAQKRSLSWRIHATRCILPSVW